MNSGNLIKVSVAAVLGVVLIASLALPLISEATKTTDTFTNEGVFNYGVFDTSDTYELEYTASDGSISVNDTVVTPLSGISTTNYGSYSVVSADNVLLRYGSNSGGYFMQVVGCDSTDATINAGGAYVYATIANNVLSVSYGATSENVTTKTFEFNELYAIVPDSDEAILKASASEVYIKGDSELYATGVTTVTQWYNVIHFEGTYDDGITLSSPNFEATFDNIEWNIEAVDGYEDLYKLTSVEFDVTIDNTTVHATYSYFAVPSEVTAEKSVHLDSSEITMLELVPLLLAVSLILGVIAYAIRARLN